jgi:hypothetical protein
MSASVRPHAPFLQAEEQQTRQGRQSCEHGKIALAAACRTAAEALHVVLLYGCLDK